MKGGFFMARNTRKAKGQDDILNKKTSLKEMISEALDLPKELIMDIPRITMIGSRQLFLENYKGIVEYEDNKIRIKIHDGIIKLEGRDMLIKEITSEDIMVSGTIHKIEFQEQYSSNLQQ
jgi:sporulation protein YqfC